ncbi:MAG: NAD-dependent deacylase [Desulfobulbaceae bacterium]|nr:MAG: NAD-dependent deacylase [Desulfobulbaceae bacterium]
MHTIDSNTDSETIEKAVTLLRNSQNTVALTGAGISVGSGIPDFRSDGGLWTEFPPDEYATIEAFHVNPEKAWQLFRALGHTIVGKQPNPAHQALAELEQHGLLTHIVTQNVDNLHQVAGSNNVLEIHGDHLHLQCLVCETTEPFLEQYLEQGDTPRCEKCRTPLKPNVVLFGEPVRHLGAIEKCLHDCTVLLVIGTSAQVYPAAGLPEAVKRNGGLIFEFNHYPALGRSAFSGVPIITDFFFSGDVVETLPNLVIKLLSNS